MTVPIVASIKARYVDVVWSKPLSPNGVLINYKIKVNDDRLIEVMSEFPQISFLILD